MFKTLRIITLTILFQSATAAFAMPGGGLYSINNQRIGENPNPYTGTTSCYQGWTGNQALVIMTENAVNGKMDQMYLYQCGGGFYSVSNQHNVDKVNPNTGTLGCWRGQPGQLLMVFNALNTVTGRGDQFFLYQCRSRLGAYSVSIQQNVNQVNPVTGATTCPLGSRSVLALQFNATNPTTGTPDQFSLYQCVR